MIFISYAKEDYDYACDLYAQLHAAALDPWMDKPPPPWRASGILPGDDWEEVIEARITAADYIILLLSVVSVAKKGYVRYEFRRALEIMSTMGGVRVIPVRIDDCIVPPLEVRTIRLRALQWEDVPRAEIPQLVTLLVQMSGMVVA